MAYNGGYDAGPGPGGGRPYGGGGPGPGAQRPPPQRQPPPQQYDQYQDGQGYGYDDYGNGYDQGYGGGQQQFDDMNYQGRGGPPNDYPPQNYYEPGPNGPNGPMRGGRGGRGPMMNGRGGPMRPPPDGGRGGPYPPRGGGGYPQGPPGPSRGGYPQGRGGRPGLPERGPGSDPSSNRRPPMNGPTSPIDQGFGGSGPFPSFPGAQRRAGAMEEDQISMQMEHMEISGQRPAPRGPGPNGPAPQRGPMRPPGNGYGGPGPMGPPRGTPQPYSPQEYPDQRRGPPPGPSYGSQGGYPDEGFGPPGRSMTMPGRDPMGAPMAPPGPLGPLQRRDSAPQNGPMGRGVPPRPNTAQTMRPPPQRNYPPNNGPPIPEAYPDQGYGGQPDHGYGGQAGPGYEGQGQARPTSFDDFYDYYDDSSNANNNGNYPPANAPPNGPNYDGGPRPRNSYDQQMQPGAQGYEQAQRGPGRVAEMNRAKSQPDLRNSQEAIFEMAGDIPPMPTNTQFTSQNAQGAGPQNFQGGLPERSQSFQRPTPPGQPGPGLPSGPAPYRPGVQSAPPVNQNPNHNPDSLPSHPVPVRPGLMPGSIVNLSDKPPPVRNYSGNYGAPSQVAPPPMQSSGPPPMQPVAPPQPAKPVDPPVTAEELERLRAAIRQDPNDQASALRLAKKLVEASEALIPNLPDPKARARSREKYLVDAHKILRKLEKGQNPDAMFFLADCLGRGMFGSEPDHAHAFTLYQSAAKLGHAAAAYRTAVCCEIGNDEGGGTRKDPNKAIQWYKRAATLGDTPAMYKVGMILLKGLLGQQRNQREAISWLKRAAERSDAENPHALHELGLLYESADKDPDGPIIKDEAYALQLFTQAAELGYKFSQFRLGAAYEYGLMGCPINPQLSIMWYSRAAMQEEHQSELALAGWYLTGSEPVLQRNDMEAYLWARKAATAGLAKAEYAMGYFTEEGIGVPANLEDAKRWYWRAAAQDYPKARGRLEELKRLGKNAGRSGERDRISRSKIGKQNEGECSVM